MILSGGMFRSGSTWLYNAVRLIFSSSEAVSEKFSAGWIKDLNEIEEKDFIILKTHRFNRDVVDNSEFVLYSYRDIRDAFASSVRKFNTSPSIAEAERVLRDHEKWMAKADFVMRYETMIGDRENMVAGIITALSNKLDIFNEADLGFEHAISIARQIDKLSERVTGSADQHHKESLLYEGHITHGGSNTWRGVLDDKFILELNHSFAWWFDKYGYSN